MSNSARSKICQAYATKFKEINGIAPYTVNIYSNVSTKMRFFDQVDDYPTVIVTPGRETREYLPGEFRWANLAITVRVYVYNEDDPQSDLEKILSNLEMVIDDNNYLVYDSTNQLAITDCRVINISTDEGVMSPYGIGEIILLVRYAI